MPEQETFLGQILVDGNWLDYARGYEAESRRWYEADPEGRRIVDWIYKERVIFPAPITCKHCLRTIVKEHDYWVDPEATGDDVVWREVCGDNDTFTSPHEPQEA